MIGLMMEHLIEMEMNLEVLKKRVKRKVKVVMLRKHISTLSVIGLYLW